MEPIPFDILEGRFVRLLPLDPAMREELTRVADDALIWRHVPLVGGSFARYFDAALDMMNGRAGNPYVVELKAERRLVGMTRLFDTDAQHKRTEIGHTWYHPSVWASAVNPEAKRLLLAHCFDTWGARRVQLKTDHENTRSQAAIKKLGAKHEGVLRAHMIRPDGSRRDTVMFSIIAEEWPAVREGLDRRIAAAG